ncbi:MAG: T9SS type A sorting domain-containing protein [bacterium]
MKTSIIILFLLSCSFLQSQNFWMNTGLKEEGEIYNIVTNSKEDIFFKVNPKRGLNIYINAIKKWEYIENEYDRIRYDGIAVDKYDNIYTSLLNNDVNREWYIAKSTDYGETWEKFNKGIVPVWDESDTIAFILGSNNFGDVFINQSSDENIYKLTDNENTPWQKINTDTLKIDISDYTFDTKGNLYIVGDRWKPSAWDTNWVYKFNIHTNEWTKLNEPILKCFVPQISADDKGYLYAYSVDKETHWPDQWYDAYWIKTSTDGGDSWEKLKKIPTQYVSYQGGRTTDIIITKENDFYMPYALGILKCNTSDFNFKEFNDGLPDSCEITCMHLSRKGFLYLGTRNGEIYVSREPVTDVEEDNKILDKKLFCYPNPTSNSINLRYRIESAGMVNIFLTDVLGNKTPLKSEYKFAGDFVEMFNLTVYPQGIYNVVLQKENQVHSEKVVIIR